VSGKPPEMVLLPGSFVSAQGSGRVAGGLLGGEKEQWLCSHLRPIKGVSTQRK